MTSEEEDLVAGAADAAKQARDNIARFLELQAESKANLIMLAHDEALRDAELASELAESNIRRFLKLQAESKSGLIMLAHGEAIEKATDVG